mgnify:CR=1 FL=1
MVNPFRGEVALRVQPGVSLALRYTCGALADLQNELGIDDLMGFVRRIGSPRQGDVALLVFEGCQARHAQQVDSLAVAAGLVEIAGEARAYAAVIQAFAAAWPEADPDSASKPQKAFVWTDLLRDALRAGIDHDRFWAMTPREVSEAVWADAWRRDVADLLATKSDYRSVLWARAKKVPAWSEVAPSLDHHLPPAERAARRKAAADAAFRRMAESVGATIERVH